MKERKEKSSKTVNKGFTLIELLVVVLIIGILAAIALPQYQLAVDKAEFTKYQAMVSSLRDAYDEYVLIHGKGTKNFNDLSFTMPDDFVSSYTSSPYNCVSNSNMFCCMSPSGGSHIGVINCGKNDLSFICAQDFLTYNNEPTTRNIRCLAEENNTRANRLCQSLGQQTAIVNMWTPIGLNNRYRNYKIN